MHDPRYKRFLLKPQSIEDLLTIIRDFVGNEAFQEIGNLGDDFGEDRLPGSPLSLNDSLVPAIQVVPSSDDLGLSELIGDSESFVHSVEQFVREVDTNLDLELGTRGFEAIAWYRPFHYLPNEDRWGIYVKAEMILALAVNYWKAQFADPKDPGAFSQCIESIWAATLSHEYFHYQSEVFASSIEVNRGRPTYIPYSVDVYQKTWSTVDCLEEALATAKAISVTSGTLKRFLARWVSKSPRGYSDYADCMPPRFIEMRDILCGQIAEGPLVAEPRPYRFPRNDGPLGTWSVPIYLVVPTTSEPPSDDVAIFWQFLPVSLRQYLKVADDTAYSTASPRVARGWPTRSRNSSRAMRPAPSAPATTPTSYPGTTPREMSFSFPSRTTKTGHR